VVGGGIYGAAAAWDASQRGLAVALVEAADFGSGVSWNSLKTIHGGLRYLQRADLARMRESIRERRALLMIAPALVKPLLFLVPTYGHGLKGREALGLGLLLNDLVSYDRNHGLPPEQRLAPGRLLSPAEVLARVPGVAARGLTGGALWSDAQVTSSERLTLAFLHAASGHGAVVANHVEAETLLRSGSRVVGVKARDVEGGAAIEIHARLVLNAAGPAVDSLLARSGLPGEATPLLQAVNLVLARPLVEGQALGAFLEGRFLFLVPWRDRSIAGTAYAPAESGEARDLARRFLDEARRAFPWAGLGEADVTLVHHGLVPGRDGASGLATRPRLVDHEGKDGTAGLVSVQGVKYTTARGVAESAIDLVLRRLDRPSPPCRTAETLLESAAPLAGTLEERARAAVRDEMARTLADAVLRRLDLGTAGPPVPADLDAVGRVMAQELGWSEPRLRQEREALAAAYLRMGF
jgi:glycerol-3-phosphate dehydrogenase